MNNPFIVVRHLFLIVFSIVISLSGFAHDFEKDGIYYNILSIQDRTVEVTFNGEYAKQYYDKKGYNSYRGSYNIPETVECMGKTFTVVSIGDYAFMCVNNYGIWNEQNTTVITLPSTIKRIGNDAFHSYEIWSIVLPEGLKTIGDRAFWGNKLKSIIIPQSVDSIGVAAFSANEELTEIKVSPDNPYYNSKDDCNCIIETNTNTLLAVCSKSIVPSNIKHIGDQVFYSGEIESIEIPNSVETIGYASFMWCDKLLEIVIPKNVKSIGTYCFYCCLKLRNVNILGSLDTIPSSAFAYSNNLFSIKMPETIKIIEDEAFSSCSELQEIDIPLNVKSIGYKSFYKCAKLNKIIIPQNIETIGDYAFEGCDNLSEIVVCSSTPIVISEDCFPALSYKLSTLFVPIGSKDIYSKSNVWKNFFDIQEFDPTIVNTTYDEADDTFTEFDLRGIEFGNSKIKIIRTNSGAVRKVFQKQ